jgi:hypothetical protein
MGLPDAYSHTNTNSYSYSETNSYAYSDCYRCTEPNANTDSNTGFRSCSDGESCARIDVYFFNCYLPMDCR